MRRRSIIFDAVLAVVVLALVQAEVWAGVFSTHRQGPRWAQAVGYGVPAALLILRRRRPLLCVVAGAAAMAVEFAVFGSPEGNGVMLSPLIAAYTVACCEERGRALCGLGALLALGVCWVAFDPVSQSWSQHAASSAWISPWVIAWLLGAYRRTRRLYVEGLVRERDERAVAAVVEERSRIARELHDIVGHSVSVMTVQAAAVRRLMRADQQKERAALETVEETGREALAEMRRVLGVLRSSDGTPELAPPPTLGQLEPLVETFRRAGLDVQLDNVATEVSLPPGLDLTAYRLVQEGLTNALKHADAHRAWVRISPERGSLHVSIRDDGRGGPCEPGNGLRGMRERVAMFDGALSAGAVQGGGFELRAELPLAAS
ncbi:MAG TPA: sensor histidine kinase [Mycobacteriales bacterium]|nr:sensor histidine kinase [Mycobacteriales bacterium]